MRTSRPTMILSLAVTLTWLGWMPIPAEAGTPDSCQVPDTWQVPDACAPVGGCDCSTEGSCTERPCDDLGTLVNRLFCRDDCGPRWTFTGEGIALQRSNTRSQLLFLQRDQTSDID
jgi:hypothetical protein